MQRASNVSHICSQFNAQTRLHLKITTPYQSRQISGRCFLAGCQDGPPGKAMPHIVHNLLTQKLIYNSPVEILLPYSTRKDIQLLVVRRLQR